MPSKRRLSARQTSVLFTIVAIILWSYSICRAQFDIGLYGLISSFPITFFIGLAFLTIASAILWVSPRNEGKLLLLQTCLFLIMLWLTPLLIAPTIECCRSGALGHLMHTGYLLQTGHLDPLAVMYHNWPGASIVCAAFVDIFGWHHADSLLPVIGITPLVASFLSLPLLYIFLKNMLGEGRSNYCWAGVWLFNAGYSIEILMLAGHGFGFFLFLAILALISTGLAWERGYAVGHRLGTILIFAALVITHLFSSLIGFIAVMASYATKKLKTSTLVILAALFIAAWTIYGTAAFFEANLPDFVSSAFRLEALWTAGVGGRFVGSQAHQNVVLIRIVALVIFLAIGIAGAILSRKVKWDNDKTALAMAAGFLVLAVVMGMSYGGELPMRIFQILLPIIAYFGVKLLLYRRATAFALCAVLVLVLPLHFIAKYGNHYTEYRSPAYFTGVHFFFDNAPYGQLIEDAGSEPITELRYTPYRRFGFADIAWEEDIVYHPGLILRRPCYIAIANDEKFYDYILADPEAFAQIEGSLNSAKNCHLIYVNPDIQFYNLIPPKDVGD